MNLFKMLVGIILLLAVTAIGYASYPYWGWGNKDKEFEARIAEAKSEAVKSEAVIVTAKSEVEKAEINSETKKAAMNHEQDMVAIKSVARGNDMMGYALFFTVGTVGILFLLKELRLFLMQTPVGGTIRLNDKDFQQLINARAEKIALQIAKKELLSDAKRIVYIEEA